MPAFATGRLLSYSATFDFLSTRSLKVTSMVGAGAPGKAEASLKKKKNY